MKAVPLLSILVLAPWLGALVLGLGRRFPASGARLVAMGASLTSAWVGAALVWGFDRRLADLQFVERHAWVRGLGGYYHLGLDGLGLLLVLLVALVAPVALWALLREARTAGVVRARGAAFLLLQGCALGVFSAQNFFPWFLCWELSLVPAYALIRAGGRGPAASVYVIYALVGGLGLVVGFAAIYAAVGSLDFPELRRLAAAGELRARLSAIGERVPILAAGGVLVGVAVKAPLFPFHGWLPGAYAAAPAGAAMLLTGVFSKLGVFGFVTLCWRLFPQEIHAWAPFLQALALAGVLLGALAAWQATDLRGLLAYSSLNHVGYCLVGLLAVAGSEAGASLAARGAALTGVILQAFNHGVIASGLFLGAALVEERVGGRRPFTDYGGLRGAVPVLSAGLAVVVFASLGVPGLNGFAGEFLIFRGVFGLDPAAAVVALLGVGVSVLGFLDFWRQAFHGPRRGSAEQILRDIQGAEKLALGCLLAVMVLLGVAPSLLTGLVQATVGAWLEGVPAP